MWLEGGQEGPEEGQPGFHQHVVEAEQGTHTPTPLPSNTAHDTQRPIITACTYTQSHLGLRFLIKSHTQNLKYFVCF